MKGAGKTLLILACFTGFFLAYVHGQVMLLRLSYSINRDSRQLAAKTEEFLKLKFQVEQLKAPRLLENKMGEFDLNLTLPKQVKVVRVAPMPVMVIEERHAAAELPAAPPSFAQRLGNVFGRWVGVAQAKTEN